MPASTSQTTMSSPGTVPQASRECWKNCAQVLTDADSRTPVSYWLAHRLQLSDSSRRQAKATLGFLGVLTEPWRDNADARLIEEVEQWRSAGTLPEMLAERFRACYVAAGCDPRHADLIGVPGLSEDAIERVLQDEPPFRRFDNSPAGKSALRFARQIHTMIIAGQLLPTEDRTARLTTPSGRRETAEVREAHATVNAPIDLNDQGTVVAPKSYRVGRLREDLWVYGVVHFESPQGATTPDWLDRLGPEEQARYLEQLAAALLHEADSLRAKQK